MNRDTIQKLLGGYATGTLTPEERQALFAAALDDQELFDALAREQSLRDLLRDPAAKAQVLIALDTAPDRWYKTRWWLPAAAAVAMAGIALLAVVVGRRQAHAPAPVIVAEMKRTEVKPAAPVPAPPLLDSRGSVSLAKPRLKPAGIRDGIVGGVPSVEVPSPPPASLPVEVRAEQPALAAARKDEAAQSQAPPAPPPAPLVQNQQQPAMFRAAVSSDANGLDTRSGPLSARLLFYANPAGVSAGSVGRLEIAAEQDSKKKAAPAQMRAASGMVAARSVAPPAAHLGVRCSILRKRPNGEFAEAALETVLDGGEVVTLKLVPNDYGYLFIWEIGTNGAWRQVANGPAEPLKLFETPLAGNRGAGPRQIYVQFTRNGPAGFGGAPSESLLTQARNNLLQTEADAAEKATYVVNRVSDPAAQQLIIPITLNYK